MKRRISMMVVLSALGVGGASCVSAGARRPMNVIVMVCDGCGYNHIDAAGLYDEEVAEVYAGFDVKLAMSTYSVGGAYDPQRAWSDFKYVTRGKTDSAAAATAMACGIKTYDGAIGVDANKAPVENVIERCEKLGKATGVVTSVPWSHATPAGFVAHNTDRGNYEEISAQMIASGVEVIMGAGHPFYDKEGRSVDKADYKYIGRRTWEALVKGTAASDADGDGSADRWTLIESKGQFAALMKGETPKRVCGTAQVRGALQQERGGAENAAPYEVDFIGTVPTLRQMALGAINVLDEDADGFFLMVEGGAVDWASHDHQAGRMIEEMASFVDAIDGVVDWIESNSSWDRTLLVVTSDHETGYLTGPGSGAGVWKPLEGRGRGNVPGLEWHEGGHTNSLVPFYARGCGAELFDEAAVKTDPVRGRYLENTNVGGTIFSLLEMKATDEIQTE